MCLYNSPLSIYFADVWSTFSPICATRYYSPTNRGPAKFKPLLNS